MFSRSCDDFVVYPIDAKQGAVGNAVEVFVRCGLLDKAVIGGKEPWAIIDICGDLLSLFTVLKVPHVASGDEIMVFRNGSSRL